VKGIFKSVMCLVSCIVKVLCELPLSKIVFGKKEELASQEQEIAGEEQAV